MILKHNYSNAIFIAKSWRFDDDANMGFYDGILVKGIERSRMSISHMAFLMSWSRFRFQFKTRHEKYKIKERR